MLMIGMKLVLTMVVMVLVMALVIVLVVVLVVMLMMALVMVLVMIMVLAFVMVTSSSPLLVILSTISWLVIKGNSVPARFIYHLIIMTMMVHLIVCRKVMI